VVVQQQLYDGPIERGGLGQRLRGSGLWARGSRCGPTWSLWCCWGGRSGSPCPQVGAAGHLGWLNRHCGHGWDVNAQQRDAQPWACHPGGGGGAWEGTSTCRGSLRHTLSLRPTHARGVWTEAQSARGREQLAKLLQSCKVLPPQDPRAVRVSALGLALVGECWCRPEALEPLTQWHHCVSGVDGSTRCLPRTQAL
jgi:hypothetical protein